MNPGSNSFTNLSSLPSATRRASHPKLFKWNATNDKEGRSLCLR